MKAFLKGLAAIALLILVANTANAGFMSTAPDNVTLAEFLADFETVVNSPLVSSYDFSPADVGGDGFVVSQVYHDAATALFAYLYQIQVTADDEKVTSIVADWTMSAFETYTPGLGLAAAAPVYEITATGGATVPAGFTLPTALEETQLVEGVDFDRLAIHYLTSHTADVGSNGAITTGEASAILVVFSIWEPTIRPVHSITDTGTLLVTPSTYVPTPEPATLALLLAGAPVGLVGLLRRRKGA